MNEILSYIYCDDFGFHTMQVIHIIPYTMSYTWTIYALYIFYVTVIVICHSLGYFVLSGNVYKSLVENFYWYWRNT